MEVYPVMWLQRSHQRSDLAPTMSVDPITFAIQNQFYLGAYTACRELALQHSMGGLNNPESRVRLVYAARAAVAAGHYEAARSLLDGPLDAYVDAKSVELLSRFLETVRLGQPGLGDATSLLSELLALLDQASTDDGIAQTVRYNAGLALFESGDTQQALEVLGVTGAGGSQEIECIALGVHVLLAINRVDLAEKEYVAARQWGDDSLLVQLIEAWIGLMRGGRASQQAYYVYDELSQNTSVANTPSVISSLVGKSAALAALDQQREGIETLQTAEALDNANASVIANQAVFTALNPSATTDDLDSIESRLRAAAPDHPLVADWDAKRLELESAVAAFAA